MRAADTWRPMLLGTAIALAAIPLYLYLGRTYGVRGLALAPCLGMSVNALLMIAWARRLHGAPSLGALLSTALRAALIAAPAAALIRFLVPAESPDALSALVAFAAGGLGFGALVGTGTWLFGDQVLRDAFGRVARRVARRTMTRGYWSCMRTMRWTRALETSFTKRSGTRRLMRQTMRPSRIGRQ